ncbi:GroES-like protein [Annulohypoxylon truncatum]|uniref:GroES-like protein n=1 Tax=Annulohypoxylon truncatum TaxID=327061 RepID=UPI0020084A8B|nr:GroES-like protein [Annulohypoxylon truncatum]KAI1213653.1 GroES-like protein [Annulohypoxylon truncatum]
MTPPSPSPSPAELSPLPTHMKALQITSFNEPYTLTSSVPVPTALGPRELLVKVAAASYCHTDGMVAAGVFRTRIPATASHEGAGTVVRVGEGVRGFGVGDRVMCGLPLGPCGRCGDCVGEEGDEEEGGEEREGEGSEGETETGFEQYCAHTQGHVGVHIDGCFAEYVRVDERFTTTLPPELSFVEAAPLACAGRTAWRGVRLAVDGARRGEWLLIVGSGGGLGHLAVQFAKGRGARVVGVDARDEGLSVTRDAGADAVVDARGKSKDEVVAEVRRVITTTMGGKGEKGAHASIVLADAGGATALAAAATRMHGTLVQIAQPEVVALPFREVVFRDVRVRGSLLCSPGESRDMVGFIAEVKREGRRRREKDEAGKEEGKEKEKGEAEGEGEGMRGGFRIETTVFEGLEKIDEVLELVRSGKIRGKAVVVIDREQVEEDRRRGWV